MLHFEYKSVLSLCNISIQPRKYLKYNAMNIGGAFNGRRPPGKFVSHFADINSLILNYIFKYDCVTVFFFPFQNAGK